MCWVRECSQPCLQEDVASKYHALHIIYCVNRGGGGGEWRVEGMRLHWAAASERKIIVCAWGAQDLFWGVRGTGLLSVYVISHIINFISQGFYLSSPETDHSHVRFHSTKLWTKGLGFLFGFFVFIFSCFRVGGCVCASAIVCVCAIVMCEGVRMRIMSLDCLPKL